MVVRSGRPSSGNGLPNGGMWPRTFASSYGADADAPRAVALSIDTNDTHAPSEGLIGAILFRSSD